ncbi:hypothetical protein ABZP36_015637 [Zizania latifolia]
MKKRVRAFTEGVVLMVSPLLLAVALKQADLNSKRNRVLRIGIAPLAAAALEAGLLQFICLCLSELPCDRIASLLFRASKLLVHLCALLLMVLAYGILLLIDVDKYLYYYLAGLVLVLLVPLTVWCCYLSTRNEDERDHRGDGALENSVDFSAAVTALLFLGLEGLAMQRQSSAARQELQGLFTASLDFTYFTCAVGVFFMLMGTVPVLKTDHRNRAHMYLDIALAIAIAVVVVLIAAAPLKELTWLVFVPLILSFLVWMYWVLVASDVKPRQVLPVADEERQPGQVHPVADEEHQPRQVLAVADEEHQPRQAPAVADQQQKPAAASLELTKVTFTGFLAVAVPTFSNTPAGSATRGFVLLSGAAVMSGLGWRLLTHWTAPPRAVTTAAKTASFLAHVCVAIAVIPFAILASNAINLKS